MKVALKLLFAFCIAGFWYFLAGEGSEGVSIIFFLIVLFALFVKPFGQDDLAFKEKYLEKLKENVKKSKEVNEELSREKSVTYKDFRKKEK